MIGSVKSLWLAQFPTGASFSSAATLCDPAGALVLMAMDSAVIQSMAWWWVLYPSLAGCLAILLPCSALSCWLKRNFQFGLPGETATDGMKLKAA